MADDIRDQELSKEFEKALGSGPEKAAVAVDPCTVYRLIPDSLKKKLGDWIEGKLGKAARQFYAALIEIANKFCGVSK